MPNNSPNDGDEINANVDNFYGDAPVAEPFEITSTFYKWFLWTVFAALLISDFMALPSLYANRVDLSTTIKVMLVLGICLKLAIIFALALSKGPLKELLYVWGGLGVAGGLLGLLSFAVAEGQIPLSQYLDKSILIVLGISVVAPLSWCIKKTKSID